MPQRSDAHDKFRERLHHAGLRVTAVRLAVLKALQAALSVLNAQEVSDRLAGRGFDRVTVYRTLNSFVDAGIAHRVDPGDRVFRFGLTPAPADGTHPRADEADASGPHRHPHFVCDECGTVQCLEDTKVIVKTPRPGTLRRTPAKPAPRPPRITRQEVLLHGTCGQCAPSPRKRSRP